MKPLLPPDVPGETPAERMSNALRTVLKVSKEELLKREAEWKAKNGKRRKRSSKSRPS